jgi:hypothetical protein
MSPPAKLIHELAEAEAELTVETERRAEARLGA